MNLKSIITVQTLEKFYTGIKNLFASKTELSEGLALKSDKGHAHDDRYYTESEINTKLEGKANSSHGTHVPTPQSADNKKFLRNDNTWQEVTPSNIGAAPTSHTHDDRYYTETETAEAINTAKATLQASINAKADKEHGSHVPTPQASDNSKFLRNDNTWQKVVPANIGAADKEHEHTQYTTGGDVSTQIGVHYQEVIKPLLDLKQEAGSALKLGTTSSTAFRGDYGNTAYQHSQATHAPTNAQKNSDITKSEIEAKLTGDITSHNHSTEYYSKTEVNTELAKKADKEHGTHLTLGTTSSTAYRGDYGNTAYTHSQAAHAPSNAQKNSDITKSEIEAKLTGDIGTHTHNGQYYTETEIDTKLAAVSNAAYTKTQVDEKLAFRDRMHTSLYPTGTDIPANADLNTMNYIKVGCYYCGANATVATLKNCPTSVAFMMEVISPLSTTYDDETTRTWVYRLRRITLHNTGEQYIQAVSSGATPGEFSYGAWSKVALKSEIDKAMTSHAHDNLYYKKSEVDTKLTNVADARRVYYKGNVGSTAVYFPLANFVIDDSSNFGNIMLSGRMGRWEDTGAANFDIMLINRSDAKNGKTITSTVSAQGQVATALGVTDIVIYKQSDLSHKAYIKASGYVIWDLEYKQNQHSVVYNGTSSTTVPTGELIWSLSTANKTILSPTGALSQTGTPSQGGDLTTKSYVDGKITNHSHPHPQPGNYFVNGFAGMTQDGVMEVGKYQDWHNTNDETIDFSVRVQCDSSNGNTVFLPQKNGRIALLEDCGAFLNKNNELNTSASNKEHKMQFAQTSGNADLMPDTNWWSLIRLQHGGYEAGYWQDVAVSFDGKMKIRYNQNGRFGPWRQVMFTDDIWVGTQAQYDAIANKNPNTLYLIKE
jgi:hypothetical protein